MTEKLYETDSYLKSFTAQVVRCDAEGKGFCVVLNRTAFFAEGGGQPADTGYLGGVRVLDVKEKGGEVLHKTDAPLTVGDTVTGEIDWARRFDYMQQHTADHIFSAFVLRRFGFDNVGFHIGAEVTHMDFSGELTAADIDALELAANEAIFENMPVCVQWPGEAELQQMEFRSKKELSDLAGGIRIVSVGELDVCACCGTHVTSTGEVGLIKIIGSQSYKGGVRVFLLAGGRATALAQREHRQIEEISGLLSAKQPTVVQAVTRLKEEAAASRAALAAMREELLNYKAAAFAGQTQVVTFEDGLTAEDLRRYALLLVERGAALAAVFSGSEGNYKYALATATGGDARAVGKALNAAFAGRGGGKPELVQGSVAGEQAAIAAHLAAL